MVALHKHIKVLTKTILCIFLSSYGNNQNNYVMAFVSPNNQKIMQQSCYMEGKPRSYLFNPGQPPSGLHSFKKQANLSCIQSHNNRITSSTALQSSLVYSAVSESVSRISPTARVAMVVGTAIFTTVLAKRHGKQILYPGTQPDSNFQEPLPEGSYGCPFWGGNFFKGSTESGPGLFFKEKAKEAGNPRIFKYLMLGKPLITVSGMKNIKEVFSKEFKTIHTRGSTRNIIKLFGARSLIMAQDSENHSFLRRLVGQAMAPDSLSKAVSPLIQTANDQINLLLKDDGEPELSSKKKTKKTVVMEDIVTDYTLDVAWRQIIGLNLKDEEIPKFRQAVNDWINGITNIRVMLLPGVRYTKAGKAHAYIVSLIEERITSLEQNGPDGSTLSAMLYATDDDSTSINKKKKLDREEIIDNVLLLILAGTETSASTLTVATLLLGLHPNVYQKLRKEQEELIQKHDRQITREQLDKECPYLEAVIKETMRIKPLASTGAMRTVSNTMVVDGKQIPKGYGVTFNIPLTHENDPVVYQKDGSHMDVTKGFQPERWLQESTRPSEFVPFGYGPRYCLGANLALLEMKVFLALMVRQIDYDLVNMNHNNVTWKKQSIIPKPQDGAVIAPRPAVISTGTSAVAP